MRSESCSANYETFKSMGSMQATRYKLAKERQEVRKVKWVEEWEHVVPECQPQP
jgi:endonuclease I